MCSSRKRESESWIIHQINLQCGFNNAWPQMWGYIEWKVTARPRQSLIKSKTEPFLRVNLNAVDRIGITSVNL